MVAAEGARITIVGQAPAGRTRYAARARHNGYDVAGRGAPHLRGTRDDVPSALGYAPVAPSNYEDWMSDPFGY